jgi:GH35 family endo-1,4-beta-xylanase
MASGDVTVTVAKPGFNITGGPRAVTVFPVPSGGGPVEVAFSSLTANGSSTESTTILTLTFDKDIANLAAGDITLTPGSTGTTMDGLTKASGTGVYNLAVSVKANGTISVTVAKTGYTLTPGRRTATVSYYNPPATTTEVAFTDLTANGPSTATTTILTLTFEKDIANLATADITLTPGSTGATKGSLTRTEAGIYNLAISNVFAGGSVTVAVAKTGFTVTPASRQVTVFYRTPTGNQGSTGEGKTLKMTIGAKENLTSRITNFDSTGRILTWSSNATNVATVDNGLVTAVGFTTGGTSTASSAATGQAIITVRASGATPNEDTFTITTTMESQIEILNLPPLKNQFTQFLIGNITRGSADYSGTAITNTRLIRHFNVLTAENEMKPSAYGGSRNGATVTGLTYGTSDSFVNSAIASGFKVHAHVLLWHSQNSTWITSIANENNKATAIAAMQSYITQVMNHYKGRIHSWDVLNEVFPDTPARDADWKTAMRTNNPWVASIGSDFVYEGYKAARLADPTAILYYNDYNLNNENKAGATHRMVRDVNQRWKENTSEYDGRLLIEGIGMQSHHNTDVSADSVKKSLTLFRELGVKISISEIDVLCMSYSSSVEGANNAANSTATNTQKLTAANLYAQYFQAFLDNRDIIERVTFWGLFDNASWRSRGLPLPFEGDPSNSTNPSVIRAKPAYYKIIGTLD